MYPEAKQHNAGDLHYFTYEIQRMIVKSYDGSAQRSYKTRGKMK